MTAEDQAGRGYQAKAKELFGEVCVDKSLFVRSGIQARSIPTFVGEWIIDRFCPDGELTDEIRDKINSFIQVHLPRKDQKQQIRNRLLQGEAVTVLDHFSVTVDLVTGKRKVHIPCIDETGLVEDGIVDAHKGLLSGGLWGAGKLTWHAPRDTGTRSGEVWLTDFKPMQVSSLDLDYYCQQRSHFTVNEWRELIVSSMGYNPDIYKPQQQLWLLTRLIPLVQPRTNLIELAPKGTGKSFVFSNLSRYVRVLSGGKISAAALFYDLRTQTPGLLTQYDVVVFDEAQTISFDNPGEVVGVLKDYLESGRYTRGRQGATADCGVVFLGNVPIDSLGKPSQAVIFRHLPQFLQETAFIDRLHGLLPGWELPKVKSNSPAQGIGFKADFFGEVLHLLRHDTRHVEYVNEHVILTGTEEMRDKNAVTRLAAGYLKLLFPDLKPSSEEFREYCVKPAIAMRQHIRVQLCQMDSEYRALTIGFEIRP